MNMTLQESSLRLLHNKIVGIILLDIKHPLTDKVYEFV